MTWWREVEPLQEPTDLGTDPNGRIRFVFNISVVKRPSETFDGEIVAILTAAGVGTWSTNIFVGSKAKLPTESDASPFLHIRETGGTSPERTHNAVSTPAYQRPSAQIMAYAATLPLAKALAYDAYNALVGVRNTDITAANP